MQLAKSGNAPKTLPKTIYHVHVAVYSKVHTEIKERDKKDMLSIHVLTCSRVHAFLLLQGATRFGAAITIFRKGFFTPPCV